MAMKSDSEYHVRLCKRRSKKLK